MRHGDRQFNGMGGAVEHHQNKSRRRGVAAVFSVAMLFVLLGFGALTLDIGAAQVVRAELQRTADAAALAAVQDLYEKDPAMAMAMGTATAHEYVERNPVWSGKAHCGPSDIEFGQVSEHRPGKPTVFVPGGEPTNAVRVTVNFDLPYQLGRIFGKKSRTLRATATAAVPPPITADVIPTALPVPGFGPVSPDIAAANPGKTSPSEPANGEYFVPGEEVAVFFYGKGPRQPVHLVLDIPESNGVSLMNRLLATEEALGGDRPPFEVSIGDEFSIWGGGKGNQNFGEKLETRLNDFDESNNTVVLPVIEATETTRDSNGNLAGEVRVVDFVAVTLTEIRTIQVPDPNNSKKTMTINVLYGIVVERVSGSGVGFGTTSGMFTLDSVRGAPLLLM